MRWPVWTGYLQYGLEGSMSPVVTVTIARLQREVVDGNLAIAKWVDDNEATLKKFHSYI